MASPAFLDEIDIPLHRFPSGRFIEEVDLSPTVQQYGTIQEFLQWKEQLCQGLLFL